MQWNGRCSIGNACACILNKLLPGNFMKQCRRCMANYKIGAAVRRRQVINYLQYIR